MTAIYHITHLDNLGAIARSGVLLSDALIQAGGHAPRNLAHGNIKQRRAATPVDIAPGGRVCDYVPFYFCARSPMLFAVHSGAVAGYPEGQRRVVHLVADAEALVAAGLACVHSEGHAAMQPLVFHPGTSGFDRIDWRVVADRIWRNTPEDNDRKRRKQAEFLVRDRVPWTAISRIGVFDATIAEETRQRLSSATHRPVVEVQTNWYYTP